MRSTFKDFVPRTKGLARRTGGRPRRFGVRPPCRRPGRACARARHGAAGIAGSVATAAARSGTRTQSGWIRMRWEIEVG